MSKKPMSVVFMGVCGSGKTTVARLFAEKLGWHFAEADDFHPKSNVDKMSAGIPLTDEDRWPWLADIRDWMSGEADQGNDTVLTCSSLKVAYRDVLRDSHADVFFVELYGTHEVLEGRLSARTDHYMPVTLLDSQLAILESLTPKEHGFTVDVSQTPEAVVDEAIRRLGLKVDNA